MLISKEIKQEFETLHTSLDELGREVNNPTPKFIPVGPRALTITEQIQRLMRVELSKQAASQGYETFAEADDLEVDDEDDAPLTIYQDEGQIQLMRPDNPSSKKAPDLADLDMESKQTEVAEEPEKEPAPITTSKGKPTKGKPTVAT